MYPVILHIPRPERTSRLYAFFRWFLALPHILFLFPYSIFIAFVQFLTFWGIIFTGNHPRVFREPNERFFRYSSLIFAYLMFLSDEYPPFSGDPSRLYPVRIEVSFPEKMSRLEVFFRFLLILPVGVFGVFYAAMIQIILFITFWVILLTGRISDGLWNLLKHYFIFATRVNAYAYFLTDEYPPFHGRQPLAAEIPLGFREGNQFG